MSSGYTMQYPPELARMSEMNINGRPGMSDAWALEQQQLRALEESAAKVAWAAEFGNVPQQSSAGPSVQQAMPGRQECTSLKFSQVNHTCSRINQFNNSDHRLCRPCTRAQCPWQCMG